MLLTLTACDTSVTPQELLEKQESGVVMVRNDFYYELELPNGSLLFFKGLDEDGELEGLTDDEDEIMKNKNVVTGTGFFVDKKGHILTNRHVVNPMLDMVQARRSFRNSIKNLRDYLSYLSSFAVSSFNELEAQKGDCYYYVYNNYTYQYDTYVDQEKLQQIENEQQKYRNAYNEYAAAIEALENNMDPEAYTIQPETSLSIAYNNTYVTEDRDFIPCAFVRASESESTDLALICLKNKKTPSDCYVFTTASRRDKEENLVDRVKVFFDKKANNSEIAVNDELHMIGFNAGPRLAITKQGLKAQITTGHVTQQPDGERLLYDIPTMQGSSGSPVVDNYGNLVAVNFAKMNGSDNFNFGIPLEKINAFMNWK